ncbi:hypothetical protein [Aureimonas leprariae]|uniref:Uncharacterized protein n=1 Tax=Plantimonas leprariae TaxID=2615207 RepID=A0A7V7TVS2_9HYPH|nr:hypothetical protein [Aureimonas leprariae]KAB0678097.1 hypothetical protein F6X38_16870 [Aureimonas leprariae]
MRGRDAEEKETAIRFDAGWWTILGEAGEVRRSDERGRILSALLIADELLTPVQIANDTGMRRNNVDPLLSKLRKAGEVLVSGHAQYAHPDRSHPIPVQPDTPHKNDKTVRNEGSGACA